MIKLSQAPVDESELGSISAHEQEGYNDGIDLAVFVINHNIVGFDISVHDAVGMAKVKGLA